MLTLSHSTDGAPVAFPEDKQTLYQQIIKQLVFDGQVDAAEYIMHATGIMVPPVSEDGNRLQEWFNSTYVPPPQPDLAEMNVKKLKKELRERGVTDNSDCVTSEELRKKLAVIRSTGNGEGANRALNQSADMNEGADPLVTPTLVERFATGSLASPQRSTCWSADGQLLACGGTNGIARVFSPPAMGQAHNSKPVQHVGEPSSASKTQWSLAHEICNHQQVGVEWMSFHPVERTKLCTGGRDGKLHLMDLATPDCVRTDLRLEGKKFQDPFPIRCGAFDPTGAYLLYGTDHETVRLYDVERGATFAAGGASSVRHTAAVADVAFAPDGGVLASCSYDGALNLYEATSGRGIFSNPKAHGSRPVTSVSFSRSGNQLITGGMDSQVRLWDLRMPNAEFACFGSPTKTEHMIRAHFDSSEKRIVTTDSTIKNVKVIDIVSGQVVSVLTHQQEQRTFSVSPTELMIATCGDDSMMRVWGTTL